MRAQPGDWLVVKGPTVGRTGQRGRILEVSSPDGLPPYVVQWTYDDHVSTVVPGADSVIVTEAEQTAADVAERARLAVVQEEIRAHGEPPGRRSP